MIRTRVVDDLAEGRRIWEELFPRAHLTDLWEVRACFQEHYRRPLHFVLAEEDGVLAGFLPLCWIEERQGYAYFPGELWAGHTWLEQNRVIVRHPDVLRAMLEACPGWHHVRYLLPCDPPVPGAVVDEINYQFHPPEYDYDMERYFARFSHRTAKRLRREVAGLRERLAMRMSGPESDFAVNEGAFDAMVTLNRDRFGERSYFADDRFTEGFRSLVRLAHERSWVRFTSILDADKPVAVDFGCVYDDAYTMLGGGTHAEYPGVAKLINLQHMEVACCERFSSVDFLCGDFAWKTLFHLTPRPFFVITNEAPPAGDADQAPRGGLADEAPASSPAPDAPPHPESSDHER